MHSTTPSQRRGQPQPSASPQMEEQLELALRQVDNTKRLYQRLHEHNDEMEAEFLCLRGALEGFRNRLHFGLRNDVLRLRGELSSVRETVVFHTSLFQRELQALERVMFSAISTGRVTTSDHELLYSGSGRVSLPSRTTSSQIAVAPPPVSCLNSPPMKPPRPTSAKNPLERECARRILSTVDDNTSQRKTKRGGSVKRKMGKTVDGAASPRDLNSSIEFFSDPETEATGRSHKGPDGMHSASTPSMVLQAVDVAHQRAVAERQTRKVSELSDALQQMHLDRAHLQDKLDEQEKKFQSYLKQMKEVHKEETTTLREQLSMMTAALVSQKDGQHRAIGDRRSEVDSTMNASEVQPVSGGVSPAVSTKKVSSAKERSQVSRRLLDRHRADLSRRDEAEVRAQQVLHERHHLGLSPKEQDPADVIRDGLWAQRVLEQRSTNGVVVRPLFKAPKRTHSSAGGDASRGYANRLRPQR